MTSCPKCGEELTQETVDVGVCSVPTGPLGCDYCHWFEGQGDGRQQIEAESDEAQVE